MLLYNIMDSGNIPKKHGRLFVIAFPIPNYLIGNKHPYFRNGNPVIDDPGRITIDPLQCVPEKVRISLSVTDEDPNR